jgi:hypothetical protein
MDKAAAMRAYLIEQVAQMLTSSRESTSAR